MQENSAAIIPNSMKVQLSRLFGESSKEITKEARTPTEWKRTLKKVLDELYQYIEENVLTDELHTFMLYSCLCAAYESLKQDNFWPGYVEGITRLSFFLMGDYPDHRRRRGGRKRKVHYRLNQMRSLVYVQNVNQRLQTMLAASNVNLPGFEQNVREALRQFRDEKGFSETYREFISWFKKRYPKDYAALF